ncbi:hypothetical protein EIP91_001435 [Steccherinum ochraceum]|uniref:Uncharacterized protein n=1 Tax=Steccherinum ochraceum TaxID=92696 RepID=A0A4R0RGG9_9APHY|nr:hypothetical protein EIP91_001435 [Steccherinum ochraceum]
MKVLAQFSKLTALVFAALPIVQAGVVGLFDKDGVVTTHETILEWIATTDANITYVGAPIDFTKRAAQNTMVVFCSTRTQNVCGPRPTSASVIVLAVVALAISSLPVAPIWTVDFVSLLELARSTFHSLEDFIRRRLTERELPVDLLIFVSDRLDPN